MSPDDLVYHTFTITNRDQAITYPGPTNGPIYGATRQRGFSREDLMRIQIEAEKINISAKLVDLKAFVPEKERATIRDDVLLLILPEALDKILPGLLNVEDDMLAALLGLEFNETAIQYGKLRQRHAQQSVVITSPEEKARMEEETNKQKDLPEKKARTEEEKKDKSHPPAIIHTWNNIPHLSAIRAKIAEWAGRPDLNEGAAECNRYPNTEKNPEKCGVGWHGDTESNVVWAIRVGCSFPLSFMPFHHHLPIAPAWSEILPGGTIYFMSAEAVGNKYKMSSLVTFRHAAGGEKYAVSWQDLWRKKAQKLKKEKENPLRKRKHDKVFLSE